jgi:O-antigen/teichoic acid export membrane protein
MTAIFFYILSVVLFGLGALLMRKTSPYSRTGGIKYERKMRRKTIGVILLLAALLAFGLAVLCQFSQVG